MFWDKTIQTTRFDPNKYLTDDQTGIIEKTITRTVGLPVSLWRLAEKGREQYVENEHIVKQLSGILRSYAMEASVQTGQQQMC